MQLAHLPKCSDDSSKVWLCGKLFVALLAEKLLNRASSVSPWNYTHNDLVLGFSKMISSMF